MILKSLNAAARDSHTENKIKELILDSLDFKYFCYVHDKAGQTVKKCAKVHPREQTFQSMLDFRQCKMRHALWVTLYVGYSTGALNQWSRA